MSFKEIFVDYGDKYGIFKKNSIDAQLTEKELQDLLADNIQQQDYYNQVKWSNVKGGNSIPDAAVEKEEKSIELPVYLKRQELADYFGIDFEEEEEEEESSDNEFVAIHREGGKDEEEEKEQEENDLLVGIDDDDDFIVDDDETEEGRRAREIASEVIQRQREQQKRSLDFNQQSMI